MADDLEDDGTLVTEHGHKLPRLDLVPSMILDRTVVVYGPSGTGKSVITKTCMNLVNDHIEQVLLVSPSESSNRAYSGFVDQPFIHYRLFLADPTVKNDTEQKGGLRFLQAIWKRQEMMASIYTRANNEKVLADLFGRLPHAERMEGVSHIKVINSKREKLIDVLKRSTAEPGRAAEKVKEINEKFKKMLTLLYKKYIIPRHQELWARADLTEDERYSLNFLSFNPRLLLIFDDCAAQLKPYFNKDIFRLLFYQNRHSFITCIICCQDDTDLPTNLRKNAYVSFFTEPVVCTSNFERQSNKFPKSMKAYVNEIVAPVFKGRDKHRKLAYIREDPNAKHFYHVSCPYPKPVRFGSVALHELTEAVKSTGVSMDKENPYFDKFRVE